MLGDNFEREDMPSTSKFHYQKGVDMAKDEDDCMCHFESNAMGDAGQSRREAATMESSRAPSAPCNEEQLYDKVEETNAEDEHHERIYMSKRIGVEPGVHCRKRRSKKRGRAICDRGKQFIQTMPDIEQRFKTLEKIPVERLPEPNRLAKAEVWEQEQRQAQFRQTRTRQPPSKTRPTHIPSYHHGQSHGIASQMANRLQLRAWPVANHNISFDQTVHSVHGPCLDRTPLATSPTEMHRSWSGPGTEAERVTSQSPATNHRSREADAYENTDSHCLDECLRGDTKGGNDPWHEGQAKIFGEAWTGRRRCPISGKSIKPPFIPAKTTGVDVYTNPYHVDGVSRDEILAMRPELSVQDLQAKQSNLGYFSQPRRRNPRRSARPPIAHYVDASRYENDSDISGGTSSRADISIERNGKERSMHVQSCSNNSRDRPGGASATSEHPVPPYGNPLDGSNLDHGSVLEPKMHQPGKDDSVPLHSLSPTLRELLDSETDRYSTHDDDIDGDFLSKSSAMDNAITEEQSEDFDISAIMDEILSSPIDFLGLGDMTSPIPDGRDEDALPRAERAETSSNPLEIDRGDSTDLQREIMRDKRNKDNLDRIGPFFSTKTDRNPSQHSKQQSRSHNVATAVRQELLPPRLPQRRSSMKLKLVHGDQLRSDTKMENASVADEPMSSYLQNTPSSLQPLLGSQSTAVDACIPIPDIVLHENPMHQPEFTPTVQKLLCLPSKLPMATPMASPSSLPFLSPKLDLGT